MLTYLHKVDTGGGVLLVRNWNTEKIRIGMNLTR